MMNKLLYLQLAMALGLMAQTPAPSAADRLNQVPEGVEEALRAKVTQFYGMQMEGKFRQSESLVCEESRDRYYDSDKRRWRSVDIVKINYEDSFQKAGVVVSLGTDVVSRYGKMQTKFPFTSQWHVENGNWCHYVPPPNQGPITTPWGTMSPVAEKAPAQQVVYQPKPVSPEDIVRSVKVSRREMKLLSYAPSSDEIEIRSDLPGALMLEVQIGELPGLSWKLSRSELKSGDVALLVLDYRPPDKAPKPSHSLTLRLEPIGQAVPIKILFDIPEEEKKKLPADIRPK